MPRVFQFFFVALLSLTGIATACDKSAAKADDAASASPASSSAPLVGRRIDVKATNDGYSPSKIDVKKGEAVVLRFTRETKSECLAEVQIPSLNIKKSLPMNTPVEIGLKPDKEGEIVFECGMAMIKGKIIVSGS